MLSQFLTVTTLRNTASRQNRAVADLELIEFNHGAALTDEIKP